VSQLKIRQKEKKKEAKALALPVIREDAAGIDIGATLIHVAVAPGRDEEPVRTFETFTRDLRAIAVWLRGVGVKTVAMESTGVYWIPLYELLESEGFEVLLVNAHHVKHVPGRKTDVSDAQWLQYLHAVGLLQGSFRPNEAICAIRSMGRHRESLVQEASACIQMMQKALTQMNLQLHHVISDITGASGMRILQAILKGERDPVYLASLCNKGIKAKAEVIRKSLEGNYRAELLFILGQNLTRYENLQSLIGECEKEVGRMIDAAPAKVNLADKPLPPATKRGTKRSASAAQALPDLREKQYRMLGVDLTQIPGVNTQTVQDFIGEVGPDLSRFRSASAFSSWITVCPHNDISGGKRLRSKTRKSKSRVAKAFRLAAQSLAHSDEALGDYYRRFRGKFGPPKAITATAHKLARIAFHMVTTGDAYDESVFAKAQQKHRLHQENRLRSNALKLGYKLVPIQQPTDQGAVVVP
jgi:transposase